MLPGFSFLWDDPEKLGAAAESLCQDIRSAAGKLRKRDPGFGVAWEKVEEEFPPLFSLTPGYDPAELSAKSPPYGHGFALRVLSELQKTDFPDVYQRLWKLEEMLQRYNDKLVPYIIEPILDQALQFSPRKMQERRRAIRRWNHGSR